MKITRAAFLKSGLAALPVGGLVRSLLAADASLPLAFSTLGCPAWPWLRILEFAQSNGFAAVELRGLSGELNLPKSPTFAAKQLSQTRKELAAHNLKIACVSSSAELHEADAERRRQMLAEAKTFVDLAGALESRYVRVFGNEIKGLKSDVVARVVDAMQTLAAYAAPRGVTVILESHGDFTDSPTLKEILTKADSPHAALLWDAHHTYVDSHEQPENTAAELGPWIRHTHLKDSIPSRDPAAKPGDRQYVLTGRGDVPIARQVAALRKRGYAGYFCFEWEKLWHPDLVEPEIAIADYAQVLRNYANQPFA